ncbi:MAG: CHAT domain-containing protein [Pleurocapsa sp.]
MPPSEEKQTIQAQAFDIKGKLDLNTGKAQQAWDDWEQAAVNYNAIDNQGGLVRSRLNQAQALQALGFYRRAVKTVEQLQAEQLVDSNNKLMWRSLGNTYLSMGELQKAEKALETSLALAEESNSQADISAAYFSLGNLARSQQDITQAKLNYQQAIKTAPDITSQVRSQLNLLDILITNEEDYQSNLAEITLLLAQLPLNRFGIYAKVNYAQNVLKTANKVNINAVEPILEQAVSQAQRLKDKRAEAYALKSLGRLYELEQKWQPAQQLTQQALLITQEIDARDIAYQAQWQSGRIYQEQKESAKAIASYSQAVEILQSLRSDLVAVSSEVQFTFRESVEQIYREYVSLLLDSEQPAETKLIAARNALDSLQLAELENFFRATCLNALPVVIDNIIDREDTTTAIVYPIVLSDRFEIIVKLPQQPLRQYTSPIDNPERVERIFTRLTQTLAQRNSRETLPLSQLVYGWIIEPAAADLAKNKIETLVFVLDSPLRNIPMSILHDGEQYLIEKYAVAITPGLQLIQPRAIAGQELKALTAGLTEARLGFPPLEYVSQELKTIQSQISSTQQLVDKNFTNDALQQQISEISYPIVHLATHGQFSSQAEDTFIITWNNRLDVNQLSNLLQIGDRNEEQAIELLVLSACETLAGDRRAALGLAGVAVKAGARSTLATLWRVNDEATSSVMSQFYQELASQKLTKAKALRQAQLTLLKSDRFNNPYFWGSYVLLGNWL